MEGDYPEEPYPLDLGDWQTDDGAGRDSDNGNAAMANTDVGALRRAWINEKAAPELLEYLGDVVDRVHGLLATQGSAQETALRELMLAPEPSALLTADILRTELSRVRYLLRAYLRSRLLKIQAYSLHMLASRESHDRLSPREAAFAAAYATAAASHAHAAVLDRLPGPYSSLLRQSDTSEADDMIPGPDLDCFVFCRVLAAVGEYNLGSAEEPSEQSLRPGDLYLTKYSRVRPLLHDGAVELL